MGSATTRLNKARGGQGHPAGASVLAAGLLFGGAGQWPPGGPKQYVLLLGLCATTEAAGGLRLVSASPVQSSLAAHSLAAHSMAWAANSAGAEGLNWRGCCWSACGVSQAALVLAATAPASTAAAHWPRRALSVQPLSSHQLEGCGRRRLLQPQPRFSPGCWALTDRQCHLLPSMGVE